MIGQKLGSYTILQIVGTGSIGTVYKAEDPDGRLVALKLVRANVLDTPAKREQFLRNALECSETRLPSVCPILEIGDDNDDLFVITPFLNGKTLLEYTQKRPIPSPRALEIALAVGSAIAGIHEAKTAHRSLRPANIWILNHDPVNVILTDCCMENPGRTSTRGRAATGSICPHTEDVCVSSEPLVYMSPEQLCGEAVDHRTDIFSFAIILYEMLSGKHPFEARNAQSCVGKILRSEPSTMDARQSPSVTKLQPILRRALEKDRERRYSSMRTMLNELAGVSMNRTQINNPAVIGKWIAAKLLRPFRSRTELL